MSDDRLDAHVREVEVLGAEIKKLRDEVSHWRRFATASSSRIALLTGFLVMLRGAHPRLAPNINNVLRATK